MIIVVTLLGLIMVVIAATLQRSLNHAEYPRTGSTTPVRHADYRRGWPAIRVNAAERLRPGYGCRLRRQFLPSPSGGRRAGRRCLHHGRYPRAVHVLDRPRRLVSSAVRDRGRCDAGFRVVRTICGEDAGMLSLTGDVHEAIRARAVPVRRSSIADTDGDLVLEAKVRAVLRFHAVRHRPARRNGRQEITMSVVSRNGDT